MHSKHTKQFIDSYIYHAKHANNYQDYKLSNETERIMRQNCISFLNIAYDHIVANRENFLSAKSMWQNAGIDFWASRNHDRSGFFTAIELWTENWQDLQFISSEFGQCQLSLHVIKDEIFIT